MRHLTLRTWGWLHFKLAIFLWAFIFQMVTPVGVTSALREPLLSLWTGMTMFGAALGMVGLVMASGPVSKSRTIGIPVETAGLSILACGPLVYLTTQFGLIMSHPDDFQNRVHLIFLAYALLSAVIARLTVVIPRFRKEAHDPTKEV